MPNTPISATSLKELLESINHLVGEYVEAEVKRRLEALKESPVSNTVDKPMSSISPQAPVVLPADNQDYQLVNPDGEVELSESEKTDQLLAEMETMLQEKLAVAQPDVVPESPTPATQAIQSMSADRSNQGMSQLYSLLNRIKQKRQPGVQN